MEVTRVGADIALDEAISVAAIPIAGVPDGTKDGCCDCCKVCIILCILSTISIVPRIVGLFSVVPFGFFCRRPPSQCDGSLLLVLSLFRRFLVVFPFPGTGHREEGRAC